MIKVTFLGWRELESEIMEFIPSLMLWRFRLLEFFTFLFSKSSLNNFAFSTVDPPLVTSIQGGHWVGGDNLLFAVSPVSWHLALKSSAYKASSKISKTGLLAILEEADAKLRALSSFDFSAF
jgi:hypothetical protein